MTQSPEEDYLSAGFAGSLGFGRKPAVIVIDMVMAYFDRSSPLYAGVEAVAESNLRLLTVAYRKRIPVIFTRQFFDEQTSDGVYVRKVPALKLMRPDSPLTAIEPSLPTDKAAVIIKHFPSAFHRTDLAAAEESLRGHLITLPDDHGCFSAPRGHDAAISAVSRARSSRRPRHASTS